MSVKLLSSLNLSTQVQGKLIRTPKIERRWGRSFSYYHPINKRDTDCTRQNCGVSDSDSVINNAIAPKVFGNAIQNNPKIELPKLLDRCKLLLLSEDHFEQVPDCFLFKRLDRVVRAILDTNRPSNITHYSPGRAMTITSSLLRKKETGELQKDTFDLTGDGGKLAIRMLKAQPWLNLGNFSHVVDIGGQDLSFVKHFPRYTKKTIMDINTLSPFLNRHDDAEVDHIIDDAIEFLRENNRSSIIRGVSKSRVVFSMSNFITVLKPSVGWEAIQMTAERMEKNDALLITSIAKDRFEKPGYEPKENLNGIISFSSSRKTQQSKGFYKSAIDHLPFKEALQKYIPTLKVIESKPNPLNIPLESGTKSGTFITTFLIKL